MFIQILWGLGAFILYALTIAASGLALFCGFNLLATLGRAAGNMLDANKRIAADSAAQTLDGQRNNPTS